MGDPIRRSFLTFADAVMFLWVAENFDGSVRSSYDEAEALETGRETPGMHMRLPLAPALERSTVSQARCSP